MPPRVVAVHSSPGHTFSKPSQQQIQLLNGLGVEGDAHAGVTVKHRSRVARDATQPNLRQVHLIHEELHHELRQQGFSVQPGDMGENITTRDLDLLGLPVGTILRFPGGGAIEITGLRNPCPQLDDFQQGLMQACLERDAAGALVRKAGIMGIVLSGGPIRVADTIEVELPAAPHIPLKVV